MKTYLKQRIVNVIDIKKLVALEYLDFEGKYKDYVESHDFWELCYVEHGDITLRTDYGEKKLTTGDIFFIPPDATHSYDSPFGNDSRVFVVCFECLSQAMKSLGGLRFNVECITSNMQTIIDEYNYTFFMNENEHLEVLAKPNFGGQQVIILQMEYMFIQLLRSLSSGKNSGIVLFSEKSFYADLAGVIIDYFNENLDRKLSLKEICTKVNYSRSFICKTFKEQTGETLFKYFNRLKMDKAKNLLAKTHMSVSNISDELGFTESKHFVAMFKKFEGVSPLVYRQKIQGCIKK
ncbi:MAG: helix-turn-helix transcriptional regulator [Clostridia bacterium]|nr:helix-turn-helix transcriptional regulator [Clostridia bacterium]